MPADARTLAVLPPHAVSSPANAPGMRWLASRSDDAAGCLTSWMRGELAPVPLRPGGFAVLRVASNLGLRMLAVDGRPAGELAPVLSCAREGVVLFLVPHPSDAAAHPDPGSFEFEVDRAMFEVPAHRSHLAVGTTPGDQLLGLVETVSDGVLRCPAPGREVQQLQRRRGTRWVVEPDGRGRLWHPGAVVEALAADLRREWEADAAAQAAPVPDVVPNAGAVTAFVGASRGFASAS